MDLTMISDRGMNLVFNDGRTINGLKKGYIQTRVAFVYLMFPALIHMEFSSSVFI
jgi:hypothetical protein